MFTFWKLLVLAVIGIAVIVVLFGVVTALAGIVWFLIKLAIVLALVYLVIRYVLRKRDSTAG